MPDKSISERVAAANAVSAARVDSPEPTHYECGPHGEAVPVYAEPINDTVQRLTIERDAARSALRKSLDAMRKLIDWAETTGGGKRIVFAATREASDVLNQLEPLVGVVLPVRIDFKLTRGGAPEVTVTPLTDAERADGDEAGRRG